MSGKTPDAHNSGSETESEDGDVDHQTSTAQQVAAPKVPALNHANVQLHAQAFAQPSARPLTTQTQLSSLARPLAQVIPQPVVQQQQSVVQQQQRPVVQQQQHPVVQQQQSVVQQQQHPVVQQQQHPVVQQQQHPVVQQQQHPVVQQQQQQSVVQQQQSVVVPQQQAIPFARQQTFPVNQQQVFRVNQQQAVSVNQQQALQRALQVNQQMQVAQQQAIQVKQQQAMQVAQQQAMHLAQQQAMQVAQQRAMQVAQQQAMQATQQQAMQATQQQAMQATQQQALQATQQQATPVTQQRPTPVTQQQATPVTQQRPTPVAQFVQPPQPNPYIDEDDDEDSDDTDDEEDDDDTNHQDQLVASPSSQHSPPPSTASQQTPGGTPDVAAAPKKRGPKKRERPFTWADVCRGMLRFLLDKPGFDTSLFCSPLNAESLQPSTMLEPEFKSRSLRDVDTRVSKFAYPSPNEFAADTCYVLEQVMDKFPTGTEEHTNASTLRDKFRVVYSDWIRKFLSKEDELKPWETTIIAPAPWEKRSSSIVSVFRNRRLDKTKRKNSATSTPRRPRKKTKENAGNKRRSGVNYKICTSFTFGEEPDDTDPQFMQYGKEMEQLKDFLFQASGGRELNLDGWRMEVVEHQKPNSDEATTGFYYFSPLGNRCRTRKEVAREFGITVKNEFTREDAQQKARKASASLFRTNDDGTVDYTGLASPVAVDGVEVTSLGTLVRDKGYTKKDSLFPVGYTCYVDFIGAARAQETVRYKQEILKGANGPLFRVTHPNGVRHEGESPIHVWKKVIAYILGVHNKRWKSMSMIVEVMDSRRGLGGGGLAKYARPGEDETMREVRSVMASVILRLVKAQNSGIVDDFSESLLAWEERIAKNKPRRVMVNMRDLVKAKLVKPHEDKFRLDYKGHTFFATVNEDGAFLHEGVKYDSPSSFSIAVKRTINETKMADDGWKSVTLHGKSISHLKQFVDPNDFDDDEEEPASKDATPKKIRKRARNRLDLDRTQENWWKSPDIPVLLSGELGMHLFGLKGCGVERALESLEGAVECKAYTFRIHRGTSKKAEQKQAKQHSTLMQKLKRAIARLAKHEEAMEKRSEMAHRKAMKDQDRLSSRFVVEERKVKKAEQLEQKRQEKDVRQRERELRKREKFLRLQEKERRKADKASALEELKRIREELKAQRTAEREKLVEENIKDREDQSSWKTQLDLEVAALKLMEEEATKSKQFLDTLGPDVRGAATAAKDYQKAVDRVTRQSAKVEQIRQKIKQSEDRAIEREEQIRRREEEDIAREIIKSQIEDIDDELVVVDKHLDDYVVKIDMDPLVEDTDIQGCADLKLEELGVPISPVDEGEDVVMVWDFVSAFSTLLGFGGACDASKVENPLYPTITTTADSDVENGANLGQETPETNRVNGDANGANGGVSTRKMSNASNKPGNLDDDSSQHEDDDEDDEDDDDEDDELDDLDDDEDDDEEKSGEKKAGKKRRRTSSSGGNDAKRCKRAYKAMIMDRPDGTGRRREGDYHEWRDTEVFTKLPEFRQVLERGDMHVLGPLHVSMLSLIVNAKKKRFPLDDYEAGIRRTPVNDLTWPELLRYYCIYFAKQLEGEDEAVAAAFLKNPQLQFQNDVDESPEEVTAQQPLVVIPDPVQEQVAAALEDRMKAAYKLASKKGWTGQSKPAGGGRLAPEWISNQVHPRPFPADWLNDLLQLQFVPSTRCGHIRSQVLDAVKRIPRVFGAFAKDLRQFVEIKMKLGTVSHVQWKNELMDMIVAFVPEYEATGGHGSRTTNSPLKSNGANNTRTVVERMAPELENRCDFVLRKIAASNQHASVFCEPVNLELYTDYMNYVKYPMDLQTVHGKLRSGSYSKPREFAADVRTVWENCLAYNEPDSFICEVAKELFARFEKIFKKFLLKDEDSRPPLPPKSASAYPRLPWEDTDVQADDEEEGASSSQGDDMEIDDNEAVDGVDAKGTSTHFSLDDDLVKQGFRKAGPFVLSRVAFTSERERVGNVKVSKGTVVAYAPNAVADKARWYVELDSGKFETIAQTQVCEGLDLMRKDRSKRLKFSSCAGAVVVRPFDGESDHGVVVGVKDGTFVVHFMLEGEVELTEAELRALLETPGEVDLIQDMDDKKEQQKAEVERMSAEAIEYVANNGPRMLSRDVSGPDDEKNAVKRESDAEVGTPGGNDRDTVMVNDGDTKEENNANPPVDNNADPPVDNNTDTPVDNNTDPPEDNNADPPEDKNGNAQVKPGKVAAAQVKVETPAAQPAPDASGANQALQSVVKTEESSSVVPPESPKNERATVVKVEPTNEGPGGDGGDGNDGSEESAEANEVRDPRYLYRGCDGVTPFRRHPKRSFMDRTNEQLAELLGVCRELLTTDYCDLPYKRRVAILRILCDMVCDTPQFHDEIEGRIATGIETRKDWREWRDGINDELSRKFSVTITAPFGTGEEAAPHLGVGTRGLEERLQAIREMKPYMDKSLDKSLRRVQRDVERRYLKEQSRLITFRQKGELEKVLKQCSVREVVLGYDRFFNRYLYLEGDHGRVYMQPPQHMSERGKLGWVRFEGEEQLDRLIESLNPRGKREFFLIQELKKRYPVFLAELSAEKAKAAEPCLMFREINQRIQSVVDMQCASTIGRDKLEEIIQFVVDNQGGGHCSDELFELKVSVLNIEMAFKLSRFGNLSSWLKNKRDGWLYTVVHATTWRALAQALAYLESCIPPICIERWFGEMYGPPSATMYIRSLSGLACRVYALDRALFHEKLVKGKSSSKRKVSETRRKSGRGSGKKRKK